MQPQHNQSKQHNSKQTYRRIKQTKHSTPKQKPNKAQATQKQANTQSNATPLTIKTATQSKRIKTIKQNTNKTTEQHSLNKALKQRKSKQ